MNERPIPRRFGSNLALTLGRRVIAWLVVAVVASLVLALLELGVSLFLQLFLKALGLLDVTVQTSAPLREVLLTPGMFALGLCVLAILRSSTLFLVAQSGNVAMEVATARLRRIVIWEALLHPAKRFVSAAEINARVGGLADKSAVFTYSGAMLVSSAVQALALAAVMFVTASGETLISLVGLGFVGLVVLWVNRKTRKVAENIPAELRMLTEGIERIARNMTLVRVLRTEQTEHRRVVKSIDAYAKHLIDSAYLANFASAIPPFAGILLIIVIVGTSQRLLHLPSITLLSFLYLFVRFVQSLSGAVIAFSTCNTAWPAFKDCVDFVAKFRDEEVEAAVLSDTNVAPDAETKPLSTGGAAPTIELRSVDFAYPGSSVPVLRDLSVTIEAGSQLGIVGPSGCGKSTLLGLLLGVLEPTGGQVLVDGRSASDHFGDPSVRVGYVGAEAFVVAGSIRDNLLYGHSATAKEDDLWDALARAQLRSTVEALPGKLEYTLGADGSGLSAGQKQRLCLARALLGRPQVLVLDEVSANLDADTERLIAASLEKLHDNCTIILASHRKGILAHADRVVSLVDSPDSSFPTDGANQAHRPLPPEDMLQPLIADGSR